MNRLAATLMNRRTTRFVLLAGLVAAVAVPVALANTIDRVVVGVPGRNGTRGFSPKLFVEVMVEDEYQKVDFDGDSGNWLGPRYHSTTNQNLGGRAKASWTVYFDKGISVQQAMAKHFTQGWERFQEASIDVPHVVNQTRVAVIKGQWRLTKGRGDHNTQFEGVLSFPLCRHVVTSAEFAFLDPFTDAESAGTGTTRSSRRFTLLSWVTSRPRASPPARRISPPLTQIGARSRALSATAPALRCHRCRFTPARSRAARTAGASTSSTCHSRATTWLPRPQPAARRGAGAST